MKPEKISIMDFDFGTFLIITMCVIGLVLGESPWERRKRKKDAEKRKQQRIKKHEWLIKNDPHYRRGALLDEPESYYL